MIISVNYLNKETGELSARAYSYYCNVDVKEGDKVIAPTANGDNVAVVTRLNVPEEDVKKFKDYLKEITTLAGDAPVDKSRFAHAPEKTTDEVLNDIFGEA